MQKLANSITSLLGRQMSYKVREDFLKNSTLLAILVWDDLGESITQSIAKADAVRGKREAFRAWISIISFLVCKCQ